MLAPLRVIYVQSERETSVAKLSCIPRNAKFSGPKEILHTSILTRNTYN